MASKCNVPPKHTCLIWKILKTKTKRTDTNQEVNHKRNSLNAFHTTKMVIERTERIITGFDLKTKFIFLYTYCVFEKFYFVRRLTAVFWIND